MKKFLLIIFIFLSSINVYASERSFVGSEYLANLYYMKHNEKITQYRRAQVIRDTVTGDIAYCIEPFGLLVNNSGYWETQDYNSRFGLNESTWDKIKLYAYFGFGYKNHLGPEWISITQMAIWRTIYPDSHFYYVDSIETGNVISLYDPELDELNTIVDNHHLHPSFNREYTYSIGEDISLNDTNNVLNHYRVISSDFDATITDNTLTIKTGNDVKEGKILLQRGSEVFPNTVKFFYSTESQNIMERGNITPINYELNIKVKSGKIIVNKVDSETKDEEAQGEAELNGAVFQLLDENKEVIKELTIKDNTLEFDNLPFGKYYIKEKQPGVGYYLNQKEYEIIIDENNLEKEVIIDNQVIKSKVKIIKFFGTKQDYENNTMKKESNIKFNIYDIDGNIVYTGITDDEGIIETMLPYGHYTLVQVNTTDGYERVEKYEFAINEDNSILFDIALNDFKIEVPNASVGLVKMLSNLLVELLYV